MNLSPSVIKTMKAVGIGLAGTGALASAGIVGSRVGASRMGTTMANAFSQQNVVENSQIRRQMTGQFAKANQIENSRLAEHYFKRGMVVGQAGVTKLEG